MVPDFQQIMRPLLELAADGTEMAINDMIDPLADKFELTKEERNEVLPSGKQTRFANRTHWARSYLKQAGLVKNTRRGHFIITEQGIQALQSGETIDKQYLQRFEAFIEFENRTAASTGGTDLSSSQADGAEATPTELMQQAHAKEMSALSADLIERLQQADPSFFEDVIVKLLLKMGYGSDATAGRVIGQAGDDGVDGVINQDILGVDQVYIQAKRYRDENKIGSGAIRDFYGALGLKDVSKGIFVTTSSFSSSAVETAEKLGARIVLIDGQRLGQLMISYQIGCRVTEVFKLSTVDESYFE